MKGHGIALQVTVGLLMCGLVFPAAGRADPQVWPFDLYTAGQDVFWRSPTHLDPTADWYEISWEITLVEVTVQYSIFPPFTVNVTNQIPPEYRYGTQAPDGPAPIVAFEGHVVYPEPPEPLAFAADVRIGLDAQGYGYVSITNVELGEMQMEVPPFGVVTVKIRAIRVAGVVTADDFWYSRGDVNCDRVVDFGDINPFVLALTNPAAYQQSYPDCRIELADINGDGRVDFGDINPFVALLAGGA